MRIMNNTKTFLLCLSLIGAAIGSGFLSKTVYAADSGSGTPISFEEFAEDPDDPQAYIEYERQTTGNISSRQGNDKAARSSGLSTANTPFKSGDYYHGSQFSDYDVLHGIDVSVYQGNINWTKAKAAGVDYAIIRVAYRGYGSAGNLVPDKNYKANIEGALAAGVDVGIYIFSQATTVAEAKEEASYAISLAKGYDISLPVVMDFEYYKTGEGRLYNAHLSAAQATKICNAFCQQAEAEGYTGMVYANRNMLQKQMNAADIAAQYPIWLACYPSNASSGSGYSGTYSYWQYTSTGSVDGISGNVDCNFRYIKKPTKPATMENPDTSYTDNTLAWTKVPGVYGYQLYRKDSASGSFQKIATLVGASNISYFDYDLTPGAAYQYRVRAYYKLKKGNRYSAYSPTLDAPTDTLSVDNLKSTKQTTESIKLKWSANKDAAGYAIYQSTDGSSYKLIAEVNGNTLSYTHKNLKPGKKFYYQVRSGVPSSKGTMLYESKKTAPTIVVATLCEAPDKATATKNSTSSLKLSWKKTTGASGYEIYQYNTSSKKYKKLVTVKGASSTSYTVKKLKAATTYRFKVRCYKTVEGKNYYSAYSDIIYTATKPVKVTKLTYKSTKNNVTLSWKKSSGATGYIIYRYDTKTKKYTKVATVKTNKYTDKKLTKNKTYKYKIVAYKNYKGTDYKAAGVIINTKTKK